MKAKALEKAAAEKATALATAAAVSSENERLLLAVAEAEAEAEAAETKLADLTLMDGRTREANNELLERLLAEQRSKLDDEIRLFREKEWSRAEAEAKEARVELLRRSATRPRTLLSPPSPFALIPLTRRAQPLPLDLTQSPSPSPSPPYPRDQPSSLTPRPHPRPHHPHPHLHPGRQSGG